MTGTNSSSSAAKRISCQPAYTTFLPRKRRCGDSPGQNTKQALTENNSAASEFPQIHQASLVPPAEQAPPVTAHSLPAKSRRRATTPLTTQHSATSAPRCAKPRSSLAPAPASAPPPIPTCPATYRLTSPVPPAIPPCPASRSSSHTPASPRGPILPHPMSPRTACTRARRATLHTPLADPSCVTSRRRVSARQESTRSRWKVSSAWKKTRRSTSGTAAAGNLPHLAGKTRLGRVLWVGQPGDRQKMA